jgi:hypothetical protein
MGDSNDVAELQAKLNAVEQEMEDAKEALRIERAKMTREKKYVLIVYRVEGTIEGVGVDMCAVCVCSIALTCDAVFVVGQEQRQATCHVVFLWR